LDKPIQNKSFLKPLLTGLMLVILIIPLWSFVYNGFICVWDYKGVDFPIFYAASVRLANGEPLYKEGIGELDAAGHLIRGWGGYIYPPFFAQILSPFLSLNLMPAKQTFNLLGVGLVFGLMLFCFPGRLVWQVWVPVCLGLLSVWGPTLEALRFGQSDLLILSFLFGCFYCLVAAQKVEGAMQRKWKLLGGVFLGMSVMIKLTPVVMLPFFLVVGAWEVLAGSLLAMAGLFVLTGWDLNGQYFLQVFPTLLDFPEGDLFVSLNRVMADRLVNSFPDLVSRAWANSLGQMINAVAYLLILGWVWTIRKKLTPERVLLLAVFIPPLLLGEMYYHYTPLLLTVVWLGSEWLKRAIRCIQQDSWTWQVGVITGLFGLGVLANATYLELHKEFSRMLFQYLGVNPKEMIVLGTLLLFGLTCWLIREDPGESQDRGVKKVEV
jgi:hypothetical protein